MNKQNQQAESCEYFDLAYVEDYGNTVIVVAPYGKLEIGYGVEYRSCGMDEDDSFFGTVSKVSKMVTPETIDIINAVAHIYDAVRIYQPSWEAGHGEACN